jgi:hypothetical protein
MVLDAVKLVSKRLPLLVLLLLLLRCWKHDAFLVTAGCGICSLSDVCSFPKVMLAPCQSSVCAHLTQHAPVRSAAAAALSTKQ